MKIQKDCASENLANSCALSSQVLPTCDTLLLKKKNRGLKGVKVLEKKRKKTSECNKPFIKSSLSGIPAEAVPCAGNSSSSGINWNLSF